MPRSAGFTPGAQPPPYVARAHQFDDSWKTQAVCTGHIKDGSPFRQAWITDRTTKHTLGSMTITGDTLIDVALTFCRICPAQWDCAIWAIQVEERCGTWAMPIETLLPLQRNQPKAVALIERARAAGTPVQVAVRRTRPSRVLA